MFRLSVLALRFTHLQSKISKLSATQHTPKNRTVLPLPTHLRASAHPLLFQPPRTKTLLPRASESLRPPVDHARKTGI